MNLGELKALFRLDAQDAVEPYLFSDSEVVNWLNEAETEAALRADLIHESEDSDICTIPVTAGTSIYALADGVFALTHAAFTATGDTEPTILEIVDRVEADRNDPAWRTTTGEPASVIVEDKRLRLTCIPQSDGTLSIECFRAPAAAMADDADEPEIASAHHRHLVQWALFRAFSVPDADTMDPKRSGAADAEFTRVFGPRRDADLNRSPQANRPMFNKAYF